ncbi:hypothetical protein N0V88_006064 [Collariella sp. IMI 366227]|nr:hypothetical protein N0V88_006064 [Collariella sp. IMI 366227]
MQIKSTKDEAAWGWSKRGGNASTGPDPYAGRGIYMCGYLDVPLDYTNKSDPRIARLAVTKFQVSGLARLGDRTDPAAGRKSGRTIVIEPGGPGASGTAYAWRAAQNVTERFSDGQYDVLGWDPRGVNTSLPTVACFPHEASRDHWSLITTLHYAVSVSPRAQLEIVDAVNAAVMRSCWERLGDLGRFVGTGMVARDLEQIRIALGEEELTGYLVSYGTGIGQTYASMFPDSVGRVILDGTEYVRDHRLRGGFGYTALDNATDAWHDGFLGECVNAGPEHCTLAKPTDNKPVTLPSLATPPSPPPSSNPPSGPTTLHPSTTAPHPIHPLNIELGTMVICADASSDTTTPDDLDWWLSLWTNMTAQSWIAGNSRLFGVLPCRHYSTYWPDPVGVYSGDLNHTLKNPVLLIAETYDPATPLRNGRRLLEEMGRNARLVAHHGGDEV